MGKRALKKQRNELRQLLDDRREALGELVLGMHVQGIWDDGLLARGAAEVKEVEDGLSALDAPDQEDRSGAEPKEERPATPEVEAGTKKTEATAQETEAAGGRGLWPRRKGRKAPAEGKAGAVATDGTSAHPEFETAEHTAEHRIPTDPDAGKPAVPESETTTAAGSTEAVEPEPTPPPEPESKPAEPAQGAAAGKTPESEPAVPETTGRREETPSPEKVAPAAREPEPSPLDQLERRLEQEERTARSGVETARASVEADSGTEVASLLETLASDRAGLQEALAAASTKLAEAERRAGEATEKASRLEAENREAAAQWVREQAAEIEADAAVAAEIAESRPAVAQVDETRVRELEAEVAGLQGELEGERREKVRAIEAAEVRVRDIEARAVEIEAAKGDESDAGPSAAELREAAVGWLRGQIVALRREMEAAERKGGKDS